MSPRRFAFVGFRHAHITAVYQAVQQRDDCTLLAACEEDPNMRDQLAKGNDVEITHESFGQMLAEVDCDAVAVGDYYGIRGRRVLDALAAGKHVLSDKPLCTSMDELEQIRTLAAENNLQVFAQLDMRDLPALRTLRRVIAEGRLGEVQTVTFLGQHPLMFGTRPAWYFEEGKHGGTINDIAIHAFDWLPWLTGRRVAEVTAARAWNARLEEVPHFQDAAQLMLRLDNDGGVLGDVSYLTPDACGYAIPQYWRILVHGSEGLAEACPATSTLHVAERETALRPVDLDNERKDGYFVDFLDAVTGSEPQTGSLSTAESLEAQRLALRAQQAADHNQLRVDCTP
jgi:predicted dehydrogenase